MLNLFGLRKSQSPKNATTPPTTITAPRIGIFSIMLVTWFGVGLIKIAPGTCGAIASYPIYYIATLLNEEHTSIQKILMYIIITLTILGYLAIARYHKFLRIIDHKSIVIDEVIGQLLTVAITYNWIKEFIMSFVYKNAMPYLDTYIFIIALLFFRFFDIKKPMVIKIIDIRMKNAIGVILDDIVAALFSSFVIFVIFIIRHIMLDMN